MLLQRQFVNTIVSLLIVICDPPCVNGVCVYPGECLCDDGWLDVDCSISENSIVYLHTCKYPLLVQYTQKYASLHVSLEGAIWQQGHVTVTKPGQECLVTKVKP